MTDPVSRLNRALKGRYHIARQVGEGGMAIVYLAHDERHDREVALKVLRPELAAVLGAQRFLAEIRTTAHLQHPHILPLFDSGDADGFLFYVMPYVEGESLRARLDRVVQLPVEEAARIANAVAAALGHAHRQGVIHRDIKPENVLISDGEPLVSDFGIALALSSVGDTRLTETGLSLGTPAYMSPEQASADRKVGPPSDIYSLGCVLYEMLTGEPPFPGRTAQAVLARKITERPQLVSDLRPTVPSNISAAVAKSLEPLPADRFETAEAFVQALMDMAFTHVAGSGGVARLPRQRRASRLPWAIAAGGAVIAIIATAFAVRSLRTHSQTAAPASFRTPLAGFEVSAGGGWRMAISRDGKTIVASGPNDMLYARRSDGMQFRPIPGTAGASNPSISPDGARVAFGQEGALRTVLINGGPVRTVADTGNAPDWYAQDEIVFSGPRFGVYRVGVAGGTPELLVRAGYDARPFMLPDASGVLASVASDTGGVRLFDLKTGETRLLVRHGTNPRYLPTGEILYGDRGQQAVFAVGFDLKTHRLTGTPVRVLPSVQVRSGGAVQLAVSDNGTLLYALGEDAAAYRPLAWVDMDGTSTDLLLQTDEAYSPRLSPDGKRVSFVTLDGGVQVYDVNTGSRTQVLDGLGLAAWSPDGAFLYVTRVQKDTVWYRARAGSLQALETVPGPARHGPIISVSPDGEWLVTEDWSRSANIDIVIARANAASVEPVPYLHADWNEHQPAVSPDGHWLAYVSDETGSPRVYVRSFPEPGAEIPVSDSIGMAPVWSPDGSAIYYRDPQRLIRADVRIGAAVTVGKKTALFPVDFVGLGHPFRNFDIEPDGRRFLIGARPRGKHSGESGTVGKVMIVVNWFQELKTAMRQQHAR